MGNRLSVNSLYRKIIIGIVIFLGILSILLINITNAKDNLNRINFQNNLAATLGDYEVFQSKTILLKDFRSDQNRFKSWVKAKDNFIKNFSSMLKQNNYSGEYVDIYTQILETIDIETKIVEWKIAEFQEKFKNPSNSEFKNLKDRDVDKSIRNLNALLSDSLSKNMSKLYFLMSENQKKSFIKNTRMTIATSISIVLIMIVLLFVSIKSYGKKELEYLDKSNKTLDVTIKILAYQVELRDSLTSKHLERTSKYVRIIAKELSKKEKYKNWITQDYINNIEKASVLHDIGKIVVPDRILHKKEKLSPAEFEEVKKHCKYGGDTLRLAKSELPFETFLDLAIKLTESHHEHWDGSGYPNSLSGDDIPLSGRIMSIADVYDALRSERVYKDELDHITCLNYIKSRRGTQFDPVIVDVFINIADKIEKISKES